MVNQVGWKFSPSLEQSGLKWLILRVRELRFPAFENQHFVKHVGQATLLTDIDPIPSPQVYCKKGRTHVRPFLLRLQRISWKLNFIHEPDRIAGKRFNGTKSRASFGPEGPA